MSLTEMNHLLSLQSSFWLVKNDRISLFIGFCWYLQGPISKITWKSKSAGRQISINYNQPLSQGMGKVEVYLAFNIQTWQSITGLIIPIIIRIPIFIIWINFIKCHFATLLIDTSVSALQARVDKGSKNQIYIPFAITSKYVGQGSLQRKNIFSNSYYMKSIIKNWYLDMFRFISNQRNPCVKDFI